MAEVKDKPTGLPSGNDLDKFREDDVDTGGAYLGFRASNIKLEDPPDIGESGVLLVRFECVGDGRRQAADGELRDTRSLKVIAAWKPGTTPVGADPNQMGLYDIDHANGQPADGDDVVFDDGDA